MSGYSSFSGIKAVKLGSLDKECVKLEQKETTKQETFDTALKKETKA